MKTTFKTGWSQDDFKRSERAIVKYFSGKTLVNHRNETVRMPYNFEAIEMVIGLPYTSSSSYAMMALDCNVHLNCPEEKGFHYDHLAIRLNGEVCLIVQDKKENQKIINI